MKRNVKLIGLLLVLLIAGNGCRYAHRNLKGRMENARMNKKEIAFKQMKRMGHGQMGRRGPFMYQAPMNGRGFMGQGQMPGMRGNTGQVPMNGMRRGMGMGPGFRMGQGQMGPGMMINRIPNLTDKQRKELLDLRQKQQEEMLKLREEMETKMLNLRETNRKNILNLLTDEQKKSLESGSLNTDPGSAKTK